MNLTVAMFLGLLLGHVFWALAANLRPAGDKNMGPLTTWFVPVDPFLVVYCSGVEPVRPRVAYAAWLQTALFLLACVLGARAGVFSRQLVSPVSIGLGLLAGHIIFGMSLLVTQQSLADVAGHFLDFRGLWDYVVETPRVLMQFATVAVAEELIYRVGAQPLVIAGLGRPALGILLVALVFAAVHRHFFENPLVQSGEFLAFALLLGALYYTTSSLILVIVVHAVRNIEIAFLEHLVRIEELGGEEGAGEENARRESEFRSGERLVVFVTVGARGVETACLEYSEAPSVPARPVPAEAV